jgi:hypothetical protein
VLPHLKLSHLQRPRARSESWILKFSAEQFNCSASIVHIKYSWWLQSQYLMAQSYHFMTSLRTASSESQMSLSHVKFDSHWLILIFCVCESRDAVAVIYSFVCTERPPASWNARDTPCLYIKSSITHNKLLLIAGGDWLVVIAPLACRQKFLSLVCSLPRRRGEKYFSFYFSLRRALIYLLVVLNNILRCQFIWKEDQPFSRRRCYMDGKLKKPRFR